MGSEDESWTQALPLAVCSGPGQATALECRYLREKQGGGGEAGDVESLGCRGTSGIHTFPRLIFLKRVLIMGAQMSCFARSVYTISHTVTFQYILIGRLLYVAQRG